MGVCSFFIWMRDFGWKKASRTRSLPLRDWSFSRGEKHPLLFLGFGCGGSGILEYLKFGAHIISENTVKLAMRTYFPATAHKTSFPHTNPVLRTQMSLSAHKIGSPHITAKMQQESSSLRLFFYKNPYLLPEFPFKNKATHQKTCCPQTAGSLTPLFLFIPHQKRLFRPVLL